MIRRALFSFQFRIFCLALLISLVPEPVWADKPPHVHLRWGHDVLAPRVRARVVQLLEQRSEVSQSQVSEPCTADCQRADLRLEIGLLPPDKALGPEGFMLKPFASQGPVPLRWQITGQAQGLLYGTYAALECLGYAFWHPLQPVVPSKLHFTEDKQPQREVPHWRERGVVHHTMHPLELTHVLNGWGPQGPNDQSGWEALLPEWEAYLEWLIAHRQNKVEWVLLEKASWGDFGRSEKRLQRLQRLTQLAQAWQIKAGIDAPLALQQQNGWRLIPEPGSPDTEQQQLRASLDWLARTGVKFLTTEMGFSEFHHGGSEAMLRWLNQAAAYLDQRYGISFATKVHISTGQYLPEYRDPDTGGPLNFNFLPTYADKRVGVMPHTVQIYSLDDPAPTYGRQDFREMRRFMERTAGQRRTLWFPETAYWVNYDIHVPLFLPVYAQRRLHDLHLLHSVPLDGQILFSSGWEWGYWLNDLVAARAAWTGVPRSAGHTLSSQLTRYLAPFGSDAASWAELLSATAEIQHRLLILGEWKGQRPHDIRLRSGMAYLAGQDPWSELGVWIRQLGLKGYQTQPDRLPLLAVRQDHQIAERYAHEVAPLLSTMAEHFGILARQADFLQDRSPQHLLPYAREFSDGLQMTALRADFVYQLYEAAAQARWGQKQVAQARLKEAERLLIDAQALVKARSQAYRTDRDRIAGMPQVNPTVYRYGYLAPAQDLYFWRRELWQLQHQNANPCLFNRIDPLEVALPDPARDTRAQMLRGIAPFTPLAECFAPILDAK